MIPTRALLEIVNMVCLPENNIERLNLLLCHPLGSGKLNLNLDNKEPRHLEYIPSNRGIFVPHINECCYPIILKPEYVDINASSTRIPETVQILVPTWKREGYVLISASVHQSPDSAVLVEVKNDLSSSASKNGVYRRKELRKHPERISNWSEIVAYCDEQTVPMYDCRFR